eukprot:3186261-Ditylum_brightwellii.AAC.1
MKSFSLAAAALVLSTFGGASAFSTSMKPAHGNVVLCMSEVMEPLVMEEAMAAEEAVMEEHVAATLPMMS